MSQLISSLEVRDMSKTIILHVDIVAYGSYISMKD